MIKHGSGMALCLKYVTNKVPSVAPLIVRQSHVSVCSRQLSKQPFVSPLVQECRGNSDVSSLFLPSDHLSLVDSVVNHGKILTSKSDSDVIRYISYLIFDCDESGTTQTRQLSPVCVCNTSIIDVPYNRTSDDYKLIESHDQLKSFQSHGKKKHRESFLCYSSAGAQTFASKSDQEDLNLQSTRCTTNSDDAFKPPTEEQLAHVHRTLADNLPRFFTKPLDLTIYHPNILLEDNIRGKRFCGRAEYNVQAKLLYIIGHLRFMYIKLDVLKITSHPEEGTVKVRWKISVLRLRKLPRVRFLNFSKSLQEANETWIDGFSTYFVLGDGLVHKHVADKMIPDTDQMIKKSVPTQAVPVPPLAYTDRDKV